MTCCEVKETIAYKLDEASKIIKNSDIDERIHKKVEPIKTYIEKNPVKSVLIGVGIGILAGTLISRYFKK